jgi:formate hydrogenlyase subunit 3/multisubunit Na+/H+ antiporter MnhD subunit
MIILALFLLAAFTTALLDKLSRALAIGTMYIVLAVAGGLGVWQLYLLRSLSDVQTMVYSAGFPAPLSIALRFGAAEAFLIALMNLFGLLGGVYLYKRFKEHGAGAIALYLAMLLGANGLVLTRDIFNSFVFMEILSISSYALIGLQQNKNSLVAGIKYMLAGGISSFLFLIGVIFAYRFTGTLNLDTWIALGHNPSVAYQVALFMLAIGVFIELKPFPANGWALDLYQSVDTGLAAIIASVQTGAMLFLFYKLLPLLSPELLNIFAGAGLVSFVFANLIALRQKDAKRLLGYSSTAQAGLIVFVMAALYLLKLPDTIILIITLGLFFTNFFAKAGLFWLAGIVKQDKLSDWGVLKKDSGLLIVFGVFVIALMGFPPFPSFYAKWQIVHIFTATKAWVWLAGLLLGSLLEVGYLMRWLGFAAKHVSDAELNKPFSRMLAPLLSAIGLTIVSFFITKQYPGLGDFNIYPLMAVLLFGLIDYAPVKLKGILAIGILGYWGWFMLLPSLPLMGQVFAVILVGGSIAQLFAFMRYQGAAEGFFPFLTMLVFSFGSLISASTTLELFIAWELMTLASYMLILRGKKAKDAALLYIVFSTFGAYLLLFGLSLMPSFYPGYPLILQAGFLSIGWVAALFAIGGFLIKMGALGVHYWLPSAYAESDDETSSILSSVLSKAGVFGLLLILIMISSFVSSKSLSMNALGWLGVFTAFIGALMAAKQEDAKMLLAYSSMSQLGYIILGLSLMSHLGWVSALYLAVNHLFFKALIFMAMAGVFLRTGTRNMYEMGGLIKKMPIAFISVLMGIIAVSGVPPLSGFGSKWFIYTSLLEQGRYLQAGLAFFSSAIAFLYLYKLIHTVFLGQAKPNQSEVKEAPIWLIIPQGIFIMVIMAISMFPNLITKPLSMAVGNYIAKPDWLSWDGYNIVLNSPALHGNWNGNLVMYVTMGVFIIPLLWLLLVNAKTQKVKQFNIVFAAERPYKPWTTHYAYNMFAHYFKAMGFWVEPRATAFYKGVAEWTHSLSSTLARVYTGNGQTYMLHIFLYMITLYLLLGVR